MARIKHSREEKLAILTQLENGIYSVNEIASMFNVDQETVRIWRNRYEALGAEGLEDAKSWKSYSKVLKEAAIQDYLSGHYSLREVTRKYEISSKSVLRQWIKKYNGHREMKDTGKGTSSSMTKGRKTTFNERIEIVLYCLEHNKNYQLTAETHKVSYQQVYQWVRKFEDGGEDALKDQRGRKKVEQELTPEEKFKLEMKRLERENERLRVENAFLKKLEEVERRRR